MQLNRILLSPHIERAFWKREKYGQLRADGSLLIRFENEPVAIRYIVEEMICCGAVEIIIPNGSPFQKFIANLPSGLRKRVVVDTADAGVVRQVRALLRPICDELSFDALDWTPSDILASHFERSAASSKNPHKLQLAVALTGYAESIYMLLAGIYNKLQIDIDIEFTRKCIADLRASVNNPESSQNLALVGGLLAAYKQEECQLLAFRSVVDDNEIAERFVQFVADEDYRTMSTAQHEMGYPRKLLRAKELARRSAHVLSKKQWLAGVIRTVSRIVEVAASIPMPDSDLAKNLLKEKYLPPIVASTAAIKRARSLWLDRDSNWLPLNIGLRGQRPLWGSEEKSFLLDSKEPAEEKEPSPPEGQHFQGQFTVALPDPALSVLKLKSKWHSSSIESNAAYGRLPLSLVHRRLTQRSGWWLFVPVSPIAIDPGEDLTELMAGAVTHLMSDGGCKACPKPYLKFDLNAHPLCYVRLFISDSCCEPCLQSFSNSIDARVVKNGASAHETGDA